MSARSNFFAGQTIAVWSIFSAACALSGVRYVRQRLRFNNLLLEDYIQLATLMFAFGDSIVNTIWIFTGLLAGYDPELAESSASYQATLSAVSQSFYWVINFGCKAVFLLFYKRLFGVSRRFLLAWWITVSFCVVAFLAGFLSQFFICNGTIQDFAKNACNISYGDPRITHRIDVVSFICNDVTDILIMGLPIIMILKVKMRTPLKLKVTMVFLLAAITVGWDICLWGFQLNGSALTTIPLAEAADVFMFVEPSIAVLITVLPTILFPAPRSSRPPSGRTPSGQAMAVSRQRRSIRAPGDSLLISDAVARMEDVESGSSETTSRQQSK